MSQRRSPHLITGTGDASVACFWKSETMPSQMTIAGKALADAFAQRLLDAVAWRAD